MFTVMRVRAGMTLEAGLPVSIVVTEMVEGSKWSVPSIELVGREPVRQEGHGGHRVQRLVQIGGMALFAGHGEARGHRAAAADLDHVADIFDRGGLAHDADVHRLAIGLHPVEDGEGAVAARSLLVAGDGQEDRAIGGRCGDEVDGGGGKGRDARFHVGGAPSVEPAILFMGGKRRVGPGGLVAHGDDIGMAVEAEAFLRAPGPPAGEEIGGIAPVDAGAGEARGFQKGLQQDERAAFGRGDGGAAEEIGGQAGGIFGHGIRPVGGLPWVALWRRGHNGGRAGRWRQDPCSGIGRGMVSFAQRQEAGAGSGKDRIEAGRIGGRTTGGAPDPHVGFHVIFVAISMHPAPVRGE
jgi:hypothetical protein